MESTTNETLIYNHPFGDDLPSKLLMVGNILHFINFITCGVLFLTIYIFIKYPELNVKPENHLMQYWSLLFGIHYTTTLPPVKQLIWALLYHPLQKSCIVTRLVESMRYIGCTYAIGIHWNWVLMKYQLDLSRTKCLMYILGGLVVALYILALILCYNDVRHSTIVNLQILAVFLGISNVFRYCFKSITNQMEETKHILIVSNIMGFAHFSYVIYWYIFLMIKGTEHYDYLAEPLICLAALIAHTAPIWAFYYLNKRDVQFHNSLMHLLGGVKVDGDTSDCNAIV